MAESKKPDIHAIEKYRQQLEQSVFELLLAVAENELKVKFTRNNDDNLNDIYLTHGDGIWFRLSIRADVVLYSPSELKNEES